MCNSQPYLTVFGATALGLQPRDKTPRVGPYHQAVRLTFSRTSLLIISQDPLSGRITLPLTSPGASETFHPIQGRYGCKQPGPANKHILSPCCSDLNVVQARPPTGLLIRFIRDLVSKIYVSAQLRAPGMTRIPSGRVERPVPRAKECGVL